MRDTCKTTRQKAFLVLLKDLILHLMHLPLCWHERLSIHYHDSHVVVIIVVDAIVFLVFPYEIILLSLSVSSSEKDFSYDEMF